MPNWDSQRLPSCAGSFFARIEANWAVLIGSRKFFDGMRAGTGIWWYLIYFDLFWFHVYGFLRSRKGAHNVTRICNLEAPSLRSWSGNTTRRNTTWDHTRHGSQELIIELSSKYHRTLTLESLESRDFPFFGSSIRGMIRNDAYWHPARFEIFWNRMRLHDAPCWNPFFFLTSIAVFRLFFSSACLGSVNVFSAC